MSSHMHRRSFLTLLGGSAAAWPLAAQAQQAAVPVIGFFHDVSPAQGATDLVAFRQGLTDAGYVEGRNVVIEDRWAEDRLDRLPALAANLVRRRVAVIVAASIPAAVAAKAATATIPIVFEVGADPVEAGLVASLNRPGGNLTGVTSLNVALEPKRMELLHSVVPTATIMALLVNPTNRTNAETQARDVHAAAGTLGLQLHVMHASAERDFDTVFANLIQRRAGGLVIGADSFLYSRSEQLAALAIRHAMPTISQPREFVTFGGLMSYGGSLADLYRLVGAYTGRILKGEKPADLPVQQVTRVELIINLKTAKVLGLTFPLTILGRADEVIE
jgi:putative tryptophan/tyrosine transport system substrate-binding protein